MSIIASLLDSDLYKYSMGQTVFHKFPSAIVNFEFKCRNKGVDLTPCLDEIKQEVKELCKLRFTSEELAYLQGIRFLSKDYTYFLKTLQLSEDFIDVSVRNGELTIQIYGPWFTTIYFEVPVLAIVNEVYFQKLSTSAVQMEAKERLNRKIIFLQQCKRNFGLIPKIADFGTRRRFSRDWQDYIIGRMKRDLPDNFTGTSNVMLAMKHNVKPIGTMAHEFIQACQAFVRLRDSQKFAFQTWADEFRGDLGIALSDTVGFKAFLKDFDLYFAKLFDGVRQDSGDPAEIAEQLVKHYEQLGIDPKTKAIVFSDGLTFDKAIELEGQFGKRIKTSYGIGTSLTNDTGLEPLQIVIKMTHCNGQPVAKISDTPGKEMCKSASYVEYLRSVFEI